MEHFEQGDQFNLASSCHTMIVVPPKSDPPRLSTAESMLYRIPSFHSASFMPILLQWEWCHLPLLQRLQLMLPYLVLIEQAVSRLFSICKCCGKGNCEKTAVGSRGDRRQQGWTRYGCNIWSRGTDYSAVDSPGGPLSRGDYFRGGTVHGAVPGRLPLRSLDRAAYVTFELPGEAGEAAPWYIFYVIKPQVDSIVMYVDSVQLRYSSSSATTKKTAF